MKMWSRSEGAPGLPLPPPPIPWSEELAASFEAAPPTVVDLELDPAAAPTSEAKDVVYALAAHELSIARHRRPQPPPAVDTELEVLEEIDLSEQSEPLVVVDAWEDPEDFEASLATRIKPRATVAARVEYPRPQIIERPATVLTRGSARLPAAINWRVAVLCTGTLLAVGLTALLLQARGVSPSLPPAFAGKAATSAPPPAVEPLPLPQALLVPPAPAVTPPTPSRPAKVTPVHRRPHPSAPRPAARIAASPEDATVLPPLGPARPNPF